MAALTAILYRETRIRATNFTFIFWDLFHPLCYMLVFGVGITQAVGSPFSAGGVDYNGFFLAGVLGMASFGVAANSAWGFFLDRDNGIFFEMLTYPFSRAEYLMGKMLFNIVIAVIQAVMTVGLAAGILGVPIRWERMPLLAAAVIIGTAGWFFFYAIFALLIRRNDTFNSVTSIFYFLFLFASSIFYPLEPLPAWFRGVSLANPITWHVDVMRYATIGVSSARQAAWESAGFVLFMLVSFWLAVRCLKHQE